MCAHLTVTVLSAWLPKSQGKALSRDCVAKLNLKEVKVKRMEIKSENLTLYDESISDELLSGLNKEQVAHLGQRR